MKIRAKESCGAVSDLTKKLAGLGGKGEDLANVERDLMRLLNLHLATWLALYDMYIYTYIISLLNMLLLSTIINIITLPACISKSRLLRSSCA